MVVAQALIPPGMVLEMQPAITSSEVNIYEFLVDILLLILVS